MAEQQKERILRFYRGSEGEETAIRLIDLAEAVMKTAKFRISTFLDPYGQEIAETICAGYEDSVSAGTPSMRGCCCNKRCRAPGRVDAGTGRLCPH